MTSIKWPGTTSGALTGSLRTDDQPAGVAGGVSSSARVAEQYRQASAGARRLRFGGTLATSLEAALGRLDQSASGFAWPTEGIPFATHSRLAVTPPERAGDLAASLPQASAYLQEDKRLSRGFRAADPTGLAPGDYKLTLALGGESDTLTVTVAEGDTNRDVLDAVADAVNASTLKVDAEVRSQTGSNILGPGVIPTGSFLALGVNRSRAEQAPTLGDASGHLGAWLDLSATSTPLAPAEAGVRQLTSLSAARPSTFRSTGLDREAAAGLTPGTYTVGYTAGPESGAVYSGSVEITVSAGDTWGDVLRNMAGVLGSASPAMAAQLVPAKRVWDSATDERHELVDATGLEVSLRDPKPGWRLSLSDGSGSVGADNILSGLGLNATAQPGSDGRMVIDGRDRVRTPGVFAADQGRVVFANSGTFGEVVPVAVLAPLDELSRGLADAAAAYNDLRGLLTKSADLLRPGLAEAWRGPIADRARELRAIGLAESGRDKLLWFQAGGFVQALTRDPLGVRSLLLGDGGDDTGLLGDLAARAREALSAGAESLLTPRSAYPARFPFAPSPNPRTEIELEKANQLLDLLDGDSSAPGGAAPWVLRPGLLRRKG